MWHTKPSMEPQLFKITQNAVVKNPSGSVLILQHTTGKWLLPGGKINKGENWMDGMKRELREELGISDFRVKSIIDVDSWTENDQGYFVITYLVEPIKNFEVVLSEEHNEYAWVRREDLQKYNFWHPKILERVKKAFASDPLHSKL